MFQILFQCCLVILKLDSPTLRLCVGEFEGENGNLSKHLKECFLNNDKLMFMINIYFLV